MGTTVFDMPSLMLLSIVDNQWNRYLYEDDMASLTVSNIEDFIKSWRSDKLEIYYRSEAEPEENEDDFITLVGDNFEHVVMDPTKDVFVYICSTETNGCPELIPHFEELSKHVSQVNDLIIARFDAIYNDSKWVNNDNIWRLSFFSKSNQYQHVEWNKEEGTQL